MNDLALNNELDISIQAGDFQLQESTNNDIKLLLLSEKGHFKQFPATGIGYLKYLSSPFNALNQTELLNEITIQLQRENINLQATINENLQITFTNAN